MKQTDAVSLPIFSVAEDSTSSASSAFDSPAHNSNTNNIPYNAYIPESSPQLPPKMMQQQQQQQQQPSSDGNYFNNGSKSSHLELQLQQQLQQHQQHPQLRYNSATVQPTSNVKKKERKSVKSLIESGSFLVACTRLYTSPCRSVGQSVRRSVSYAVRIRTRRRFNLRCCPCPPVQLMLSWIRPCYLSTMHTFRAVSVSVFDSVFLLVFLSLPPPQRILTWDLTLFFQKLREIAENKSLVWRENLKFFYISC